MKKIVMILLVLLYMNGNMTDVLEDLGFDLTPQQTELPAPEVTTAPEDLPVFGEITGFDEFMTKVKSGNAVTEIFFTEGYGFSTAEFTTVDEQEIAAILDALGRVQISGISLMDITDWYPCVIMTCQDGSTFGMHFDGHWLSIGRDNYELAQDDPFWDLMTSLEEKYGQTEEAE